jgi:hypothetical protein
VALHPPTPEKIYHISQNRATDKRWRLADRVHEFLSMLASLVSTGGVSRHQVRVAHCEQDTNAYVTFLAAAVRRTRLQVFLDGHGKDSRDARHRRQLIDTGSPDSIKRAKSLEQRLAARRPYARDAV